MKMGLLIQNMRMCVASGLNDSLARYMDPVNGPPVDLSVSLAPYRIENAYP